MKRQKLFTVISLIIISMPGFVFSATADDIAHKKQMSSPVIMGIDEVSIKVIPDKFCYQKGVDTSKIEDEVKAIFIKAGINVVSAGGDTPIFAVRITGKDFESVICATHVQSSFLRKVYIRNPRTVLMAEVWRVDVPIRFSSTDAVTDAVMAEITKQAQAFAEQWKYSNNGNQDTKEESKSAATQDNNAENANDAVKYPFVASKNSKIFHKAQCSSVKRISEKNIIGFATREQAIKSGRRPCKLCNP